MLGASIQVLILEPTIWSCDSRVVTKTKFSRRDGLPYFLTNSAPRAWSSATELLHTAVKLLNYINLSFLNPTVSCPIERIYDFFLTFFVLCAVMKQLEKLRLQLQLQFFSPGFFRKCSS